MNITIIFQRLLSVITYRGRQIRRLAKENDLNLSEAFNLVSSKGSIQGARKELERRLEEQRKLRGYSSRSPEPPQNTYTSGSRLSS
jgi:hypothetical protein